MGKQWPPPAPNVSKDFKQAHDAKNDNAPPPASGSIVTKKQIQELEKQRGKPAAQFKMTPSGTKTVLTNDRERAARIERMKKRLQQNEGKARNDFNRSQEL